MEFWATCQCVCVCVCVCVGGGGGGGFNTAPIIHYTEHNGTFNTAPIIHYTEHIGAFNAVPSTVKHLYVSVIVWTIILKISVCSL